MADVTPIPDGYTSLTPHLTIEGAGKAIDWYKKVFGAEELGISRMPGGDSIMHALLRIGDSMLMVNDAAPQWGAHGPGAEHHGITIHLYVPNADDVFKRAIASGAKEVYPIMEAFWGDRYGKLTDPFGHHWSIATRVEELTREQIDKRAQEWFSKSKGER